MLAVRAQASSASSARRWRRSGLVFAVEDQVASLTPAFPNRCRVVLADGTVAYRPGPPPQGPWLPLGTGWVLPQLLRKTAYGWEDPAGFPFPPALLQPVALPPAPNLPHLPCPPDAIWALEDGIWHTDQGQRPCPLPLEEAARLHPHLRLARPGLYFNPRRLRRITVQAGRALLGYDNGHQHTLEKRWHPALCQQLGLENLTRLEPFTPGLFRHFLRDFPFELARARAEVLTGAFATAEDLMANLAWQARHYHSLQQDKGYGKDHGAFNYFPLAPALQRAGFLRRLRINGPLFKRFEQMLAVFIGKDCLFTFDELGFEDQGQSLRQIGTSRPQVILLAEKGSVGEFCRGLAQRHGLSLFISGGTPKLVAVEFFARALRQVYTGPVFVIALVDWDPGGHQVATTMRPHLHRYGFQTPPDPGVLLRPETFTPAELDLFPITLHADSPTERAIINNWVERTGGIHGQPRGITCNCLHPLERVVPALENWLRTHHQTL
jgi:hypothetical protein